MNINEIMDKFDEEQGWKSPLYRNRPYRGQPHTDEGDRGKTEVKGITMRDLGDAFIIGACLASGDQLNGELYNKANGNRHVCKNDLFRLDWNKIDPVAVMQNMSCEVERMMGIFPNVQELRKESHE